MRHVPPVICWVGRRRGPAGCAVRGCRCKSVPLWSGSPPVQSQQGGERDKQSELLSKNNTWGSVVLKKRQITKTHTPLATRLLKTSAHLSLFSIIFFPILFQVLEWPGESGWLQLRQICSDNRDGPTSSLFQAIYKGHKEPGDKEKAGATEQILLSQLPWRHLVYVCPGNISCQLNTVWYSGKNTKN